MLYSCSGFPEEGELLLVTVTKIMYHSVFVNIDEYNKQGMIHISEVAPGRIRNIRDYVIEGKKVVVKVLKIDKSKGHIDLSLRRVSEIQKKKKLEWIKQEQKAEKILEFAAKELKKDLKNFYSELKIKVFEDYDSFHEFFYDVVADEAEVKDYTDQKTSDYLDELIRKRIKLPSVTISGVISISTWLDDGINLIKKILKDVPNISYLGAGKYKLKINAADYKAAENELKNITTKIEKQVNKIKGSYSFKRDEQ